MNRLFTFFFLSIFTISGFAQSNVEVITGGSYINESYYSFSEGEVSSSSRENWDLAFATDNFDVNIHANNGSGVMLYTYPNGDISAWENMDTTGMNAWPTMNNSIENMHEGAFLQNAISGDQFDYGWGTYNMSTHQITGDSLYVIKTVGENYKKLWIINRNPVSGVNTWSIKYANLDGSDEQEVTISADDHISKNMVHFSIENNTVVDKEPASANWDLLFTRYFDYNIPYYVTGVLANTNRVTLQQVDEVDQANFEDYQEADFNTVYSEIGSDWKTFNMGTFSYDINDSRVYFAKVMNEDNTDSTYWKMYFTAFSGSSEGKYSFVQKNLSDANSINEINGLEIFEIYPNPAYDYIRIIADSDKNLQYRISDISGKEISVGQLAKGFNQQSINISNLQSGIYVFSLISANEVSSHTFMKQ